MMVVITWVNVIVGLMLLYAFFDLKTRQRKNFGTKIKIFLVVVAITGIIATLGKHLIYLLTSGVVVIVALAKDKEKGNESLEAINRE